jgi:hypothetical protein
MFTYDIPQRLTHGMSFACDRDGCEESGDHLCLPCLMIALAESDDLVDSISSALQILGFDDRELDDNDR